ncbi:head morphogenesis protein [Shewanella avicenniae]|uniref:Head morphogenesis protein n=1 Tax=Shewanella avicenniae TaxID=2814294 RepID=A0ABX7QPF5_9GAMM|nr:phage minor head protein [Shewanella avicenniae]QSX32615.1 head morphogenesis protein [Shewanella avicenniae]
MPQAQYGSVQFSQAIDFFRGKLNLPTAAWDDLWGAMHSRAFVVAGAQQADLLTDLRKSVDAAISDGMSLGEFKKQFKDLVAKHGWDHKGDADWRAQIIYDTNMRQSYNTGRWQQLQQFEYWQYKHGHPKVPREDHLLWHNLVLPRNHVWWQTHFPQNGWGCTCSVRGLTEGQLRRLNLKVSQAPDGSTYEWTNPKTGELLDVPKGIDPGFDYSPGEAALGQQLSDAAMQQWDAIKQDAWQQLTPGSWKTAALPERLPVRPSAIALAERVTDAAALQQQIINTLGGAETVFQSGALSVYANAASLAKQLDVAQSVYVPLLPTLFNQPDEVWASFERHQGTGRVELRWRLLRMVDNGGGQLLLAQVVKGVIESLQVIPATQLNNINKQRYGLLFNAASEE